MAFSLSEDASYITGRVDVTGRADAVRERWKSTRRVCHHRYGRGDTRWLHRWTAWRATGLPKAAPISSPQLLSTYFDPATWGPSWFPAIEDWDPAAFGIGKRRPPDGLVPVSRPLAAANRGYLPDAGSFGLGPTGWA